MLHSASGAKPYSKRRCILLVDARPLTRGSIAHFLLSANFVYDVIPVPTTRDLTQLAQPSRPTDLAILNIGSARVHDSHVKTEVECLRRHFATVPLALLADSADMADIQNALRLGMRAYIPCHLSGAVVLAGLRIVLAGGIFVPATASTNGPMPLSMPQTGDATDELSIRTDPAGANPHLRLTLREMEVLRLLHNGKSNRAIAVALNIAESTAKIHVRSIRHKLNAVSRYEAADIAEILFAGAARTSEEKLD